MLLIMRIGVHESGMYEHVTHQHVKRGNFFMLFSSWKRFTKYLNCIIIGLPIWFSIGVLVTLAPEFATAMGITEKISAGDAVMYFYAGTAFGDFMSGFFSQVFKNRKKVVASYLLIMLISLPLYLFFNKYGYFYWICALLGIAAGYWAVFITIASEQFGTNIRSTVTTTVPNFVRGGLVLLSGSFIALKPYMGSIYSALTVGLVCIVLAYISLHYLEETYAKDLDYIEQ
jgi:MFS family permease